MRQRNVDIRDKAKHAKVRLWEIGERLEKSEATFTRLLRKELNLNAKKRIFAIIEELKEVELEPVAGTNKEMQSRYL